MPGVATVAQSHSNLLYVPPVMLPPNSKLASYHEPTVATYLVHLPNVDILVLVRLIDNTC